MSQVLLAVEAQASGQVQHTATDGSRHRKSLLSGRHGSPLKAIFAPKDVGMPYDMYLYGLS